MFCCMGVPVLQSAYCDLKYLISWAFAAFHDKIFLSFVSIQLFFTTEVFWPPDAALHDSLAIFHTCTVAEQQRIWTRGKTSDLPAFYGQDMWCQNMQACVWLEIWFQISQTRPLWVVTSPLQYSVAQASHCASVLLWYFCDPCPKACIPSFTEVLCRSRPKSAELKNTQPQPLVNVWRDYSLARMKEEEKPFGTKSCGSVVIMQTADFQWYSFQIWR